MDVSLNPSPQGVVDAWAKHQLTSAANEDKVTALAQSNTIQTFYNNLEREIFSTKDIRKDKVTPCVHIPVHMYATTKPISK